MKNKFFALFSLSLVIFSCNPISSSLNTKPNPNDFKTSGNVNNSTNGQSLYGFNGNINRTDGAVVPVPTPTPTIVPIPVPNMTTIYNATLFAGSSDAVSGNQNGQGLNTLFDHPYYMSVDSKNNIYVSDNNGYIRKIDQLGNVTNLYMSTLDGLPVNTQIAGGTFTFDSVDNMYVVGGNNIKKIDSNGNAITIINLPNVYDPTHTFGGGYGAAIDKIAVDQTQNIYLTDTIDQTVKKVSINGVLSIVAGVHSAQSGQDGNGVNATFNYPWGIISDNNGSFYVSDSFGSKIRKIDSNNNVTTFSGAGVYGIRNSDATHTQFSYMYGMAFDQNNNILVMSDNALRKVDQNGSTTSLIINNNDTNIKFKKSDALFYGPEGIAVDHNGIIFISDTYHNRIIKLTKENLPILSSKDNKKYNVTTIAGDGNPLQVNGQGLNSSFIMPDGIVYQESTGSIFVADGNPGYYSTEIAEYSGSDGKIRKIDSSGNVTDFYSSRILDGIDDISLGNNGGILTYIHNDQPQNSSQYGYRMLEVFSSQSQIESNIITPTIYEGKPTVSIAKDNSGNIYTSDEYNGVIRKNGVIFAGTFGQYGFQDGGVGIAKFNTPKGLTVDNNGNVYVADKDNNSIRKIDSSGNVTTLAGSTFEGYKDGNGTNARFRHPSHIVVDPLGYLYVTDRDNNMIRKIAPNGDVWTIAGSNYYSLLDGLGTNSGFNYPTGITIDSLGNLYVSDTHNHKIRKLTPQ